MKRTVGIRAQFWLFLRPGRILVKRVFGPPHRRLRKPLGGLASLILVSCLPIIPIHMAYRLPIRGSQPLAHIDQRPPYRSDLLRQSPAQAPLLPGQECSKSGDAASTAIFTSTQIYAIVLLHARTFASLAVRPQN